MSDGSRGDAGAPFAPPDGAPSLFESLRASATDGGAKLFAFPGHDGLLRGIARMAQALDADVSVDALRHDCLDPAADIETHAMACADEILARWPDRTIHLAGVCFGGCVAHAVAARLDAAGARVAVVALIDALNPAWLPSQRRGAVRLARARQWRHKVPAHLRRMLALGPREAARYLAERARAAREFAVETGPFLDAMARYRPAPRRGDALLLRFPGRRPDAPDLGWRGSVDGRLELVDLPFEPRGALAGASAARVAAELAPRLRAAASAPLTASAA